MSNHTGEDAMAIQLMGRYILPLLVPVLVGIGSAAITSTITTARIEERLTLLERKIESTTRTTDALRLRDDDYERRISCSEALLETLNTRVVEVGGDVKLLLQKVRDK